VADLYVLSTAAPEAVCLSLSQNGAAPLLATGLLQHEAKLTVLDFGVKKTATYTRPLPSKAELLLVNGVRYCSGGFFLDLLALGSQSA